MQYYFYVLVPDKITLKTKIKKPFSISFNNLSVLNHDFKFAKKLFLTRPQIICD